MALPSAPAGRRDFEIAIICALPLEASAVRALFEKFWEEEGTNYGKATGDRNAYTTGVIGRHNIVLVHMPHMGKISAAGAAASLSSSFTGIKLALIVGICGGVPSGLDGKKEIFLGDVIMSEALVQYDFGRQYSDVFKRKDTLEDNLGRANIAIRSVLRKLQTEGGCQPIENQIVRHLADPMQKGKDARYPGSEADILFEPLYRHIHRDDNVVCSICMGDSQPINEVCEVALRTSCHELGCDPSRRTVRHRSSRLRNTPDSEDAGGIQGGEGHRPQIHIGRIASGDSVVKSGEYRDMIAQRDGVIAFEMEGAGFWDYFPSLVIKGVSDYSDSHKNKVWQVYAATTAAVCAKAFLDEWASESHSSPQYGRNKMICNAHWTVTRPLNNLFSGREDILRKIEGVLRPESADIEGPFQRRFIITGMGGQGKSEICLKIANTMRQCFWAVFWVDVSNLTVAERSFLDIARKLHSPVSTLQEAQQVLANIDHSWLLILDNADDPRFDYQIYFPPGISGVVLMTSRNPECKQYATIGCESLEGLDAEDGVRLLLQAAKINSDQWHVCQVHAQSVTDLLGSHPLALIQAGSYIARGHCQLHEYPHIFQRFRRRLLRFHPQQAQSRYGHMYASFDASSEVLESSRDQTAQDALHLLSFLSMVSPGEMPIDIFEAAWHGAKKAQGRSAGVGLINGGGNLLQWHVSQLPPFIETKSEKWDSFRVMEAGHLLMSLALIVGNNEHGSMTMSMHPLTHAWARDRQNQRDQDQEWVSAGCVIGLSTSNRDLWLIRERQLRPHVHSYLDQKGARMFSCGSQLLIARIVLRCGWKLYDMRDDDRAFTLLQSIFEQFDLNAAVPSKEWLSSYDLAARCLIRMSKSREAVQLLERVVRIREQNLAENHPDRLTSQHELELAIAYEANRQLKDAIPLLERVVRIREQNLAESHPDRLTSQHELARVYAADGQLKVAIPLLERVVRIEEQNLAENHPDRLTSQHKLAKVYAADERVEEAVQLLEHVVQISRYLSEDNPSRLRSEHTLALLYEKSGKVKEAVQLLEHVVHIKRYLSEDNPSRLRSEHTLALLYEKSGEVKEAVQLLEHVVHFKRYLSEDNRSRLTSEHNLARLYGKIGKIKEAVQLLEHVVQIDRHLPEDDPDRLISERVLARLYENIGT